MLRRGYIEKPRNIEFVYYGSWVEYVKDGDPSKPLTPSEKELCDEIVERITKMANDKQDGCKEGRAVPA